MKNIILSKKHFPLFFLITGFVLFSAFSLSTPTPAGIIPASLETQSPTPKPTETAVVPTLQVNPSAASELIPLQAFEDKSSLFCQSQVDLTKTGGLTFSCAEGKFSFLTAPAARDEYKNLQVSVPIQPTSEFTIEADLVSRVVPGKPDQNNYGFILGIDSTHSYSLRFKGLYYRFEKNLLTSNFLTKTDEFHITKSWNWNFSPSYKPTGTTNHLQLICGGGFCSLNINQILAARFNLDEEVDISSITLFAEAGYYAPFGSVDVDNIHVFVPDENPAMEKEIVLSDALVNDKGIFPKIGLSGAFNKYLADGFHFSSVIPFGYHGVKAAPALGDSSISATVLLKPDNPNSSMYAGLVCRSSLEGMYFAVIRENGYFSVFRDTPTRPLSLLAQARSKDILTGGAANQLRLDCVGSTISFYINGKKAASVQDDTFKLIFGRSGFFTKAGKNPDESAITFSNLEIKEVR